MAETIKYLVTFDPELGAVRRAEQLGSAGDLAEVPAQAFAVDVSKLAKPQAAARPEQATAAGSNPKPPQGPINPHPNDPNPKPPQGPINPSGSQDLNPM